jgi:hypothetical protein
MMQLGRVRLGEKSAKGAPVKLDRFRFTSASRVLLEAVAAMHGGKVTDWEGAPDEGYFQVTTDATRLDIILPPVYSDEDGSPTVPYSQWFELWSGAGCQRRCDGITESLSGKPCLCDMARVKAGGNADVCKVTTRVSFMLPDLPGLGVWRIDSHGWNAAVELPGTLEVLAAAARDSRFIPAVLSIQARTKKSPGQPTKKFIVPVIELPDVTVRQLASGDVPLAINAPVSRTAERPALPAAPPPPAEGFTQEAQPAFGDRPALPAGEPATPQIDDPVEEKVVMATAAQKKKLDVLVGKLRDGGHLTTEQLYKRCQVEPVPGEDGELHWSTLRETLSKSFAHGLIEALETYQASLEDGSYFAKRAAEVVGT